MTSVQPRGARLRRGGRRPGWALLTALLALAIAASSVLVFTNRVELLKLAVIVSLWAAVVAAFASVTYRRQSDADQARAHHLKLVYDLQLDREISARREYELSVESELRRELAAELRDQAADEVAALRAELSALRANLEILFEADLGTRPALETDRTTMHAYSDWDREVAARREDAGQAIETPIIDVPEVTPSDPAAESAAEYQGSHRRAADEAGGPAPGRRPPPEQDPSNADRDSRMAPEPPQQPASWSRPWVPPPAGPTGRWQPVASQGEWLPPGTPGSNWAAEANPRHRRYAGPQDAMTASAVETPARPSRPEDGRRADARPPDAPESARHRSADPEAGDTGPATGGESVAELLARLQAGSTEGPRRRRRRAD